ncbi:Kazal-type serine protease inhibitor family protein [Hymenobacter chitinivorans]|uniref:Kazal-type serine protease inhibitor-like protein n=1 Tax=Hymenobacter chitinivorans DSM 11115 TaxID=1121954 RepID=A0A2M9BPE7_9BACT|nr:Kazal-type serine protease inhibitor [Hymenobacter chitinivorans]PJJ59831.1 hypothetical protein CLV45_1253 [Hymenobacter chitinivorans DSM 11115]
MKKLAVFALLLFAGTACSKETAAPAAPTTTQAGANAKGDDYQCLDVYAPVCANGVTYPNACYAGKAGVTTYTKGACDGSGGDI